MYGKWPVGKQTRWWVAVVGILPKDHPEAFLKFIEPRHPIVLMLASQGAMAGVGNGDGGRSSKLTSRPGVSVRSPSRESKKHSGRVFFLLVCQGVE
jgi:hypothetical protein